MSLRLRLIAGLLVLTGAGLLVLGGVTYAEQRSFLHQRVDLQARSAVRAVAHELDSKGINVPGSRDDGPGTGGPPLGLGYGRGLDAGEVSLPPGTYGQRRDGAGRVLGSVVLFYGGKKPPAPQLPAKLAPGSILTVGSVGGSEGRYRAFATQTYDQPGITVVAVPLGEVDQTLERLLLVEALVIGGVLLALAVGGWWMVRLGLRPLDRMGETAGAIAAGDLARRVSPATPRTEVGRLGLALNGMLERLEEAFAERQASENRLRRFLADASHELRTPLSSIRGYAELLRTGVATTPAEADKATNRIEQEAARMGVLVEDLLTLARLDEVHAAIRQSVDLADLAHDAADDARAAAPDRDIEVHAEGPTSVLGDPHQLQQVLANLVRNALVHTPAGTPVELSVRREGGDARLEVRDHGPGLPAGEGDAVFERFWRAAPGRARGRAGAGLGLAIVAGVVAAHGGRVEAADAEGGGAAFVVRLPAEARAPAASEAPVPG